MCVCGTAQYVLLMLGKRTRKCESVKKSFTDCFIFYFVSANKYCLLHSTLTIFFYSFSAHFFVSIHLRQKTKYCWSCFVVVLSDRVCNNMNKFPVIQQRLIVESWKVLAVCNACQFLYRYNPILRIWMVYGLYIRNAHYICIWKMNRKRCK